MISLCEKVELQQLRKAKYLILASILHKSQFFFLAEPHTYLCYTICKSHVFFLYLALNLETSLKKFDFLEKFILSFFFKQDQVYQCFEKSHSCIRGFNVENKVQKVTV